MAGELFENFHRSQRRWEQLTFRSIGTTYDETAAATSSSDLGTSRSSFQEGGGQLGIPGVDALTLSSALAWIPVPERLACRVVRHSWVMAAERGPARVAWLDLVGADVAAEATGSSLVSCYSHHRFLSRGFASDLFRGPATKCGEMSTPGRIAASTPAVPLADGTAVALVDTASAVAIPDISLCVYNMSSMHQVGSVPIKRLRHGQSIQRPLRVRAFQGLHAGALNPSKGCIAAIERLVVVFSWRLGLGDVSALELLESRADEVRWGENSREVLCGVSFVGASLKVVSVLLEGLREGPVVEIYEKGISATSGYELRQTISIPVGKPCSAPSSASSALRGGVLFDGLALWATAGDRSIRYVTLPKTWGSESGEKKLELCDIDKGIEKSGAASGAGAAAIFARAKQASKRCKLCVDADGGAGLDLEACRWGYVVEEVSSKPGQQGLAAGDCIIAIAGQSLHDLGDEDLVHWRFGRNFADGAEITVIPAEHARSILAAEEATPAKAVAEPIPQASVSSTKHAQPEPVQVRTLEMAARLEAWCVDVARDPARILAVADNCLYVAKIYNDGGSTSAKLVSGVVRSPWKRPIVRVELLHASSDVVLLGVAGAVLVWRVPALVASIGPEQKKEPELLVGVSMPPRCTLAGMCCSVLPGVEPFGWIAVELGGMCMDSTSSLELWHFFKGSQRPLLRLPKAVGARGSTLGAAKDVVSQSLNNSGAVMETFAAAVRNSVAKIPATASSSSGPIEPANIRSWTLKLPELEAEALYTAVNGVEQSLAEVVRDLRRWLRQSHDNDRRADLARDAVRWAEELRRNAVWPLQAAFETEHAGSGSEEEEGVGNQAAPSPQ